MNEPTALCYPIREPFKFRGVTVKPPAFVQMERDEARKYIDAGVIGDEDEASLVPDDAERLEAERLEAERLEADRKAADTATDTGAPNGSTTPNGAAAPGGADAGATDGATAAADAAKGAGEDGKTAKDGDTKTTAAGAPAAGGRGARRAAR
jgi:hypothetical protein